MTTEATDIRRTFGQMTVVGDVYMKAVTERGKTYNSRYIKVMCSCKRVTEMPLTRWNTQPSASCKPCSISKRKRSGYMGIKRSS
jgi:hypothetical protein